LGAGAVMEWWRDRDADLMNWLTKKQLIMRNILHIVSVH
jgi:hypothetical protein